MGKACSVPGKTSSTEEIVKYDILLGGVNKVVRYFPERKTILKAKHDSFVGYIGGYQLSEDESSKELERAEKIYSLIKFRQDKVDEVPEVLNEIEVVKGWENNRLHKDEMSLKLLESPDKISDKGFLREILNEEVDRIKLNGKKIGGIESTEWRTPKVNKLLDAVKGYVEVKGSLEELFGSPYHV